MSYAPKHAKPTSLLVAVLGVRHDDSADDAGTAGLTVPAPRTAADDHIAAETTRKPEQTAEGPAANPVPGQSLREDPRQNQGDVVLPVRAQRARDLGAGRLQ